MAADWKIKYLDIRAKLKEATDVAFRLGYERGMKDGTQAAQMQAMAQQQQQQAAMMGGAPGQPGQDPAMQGDPSQDPAMQGAPGEEMPQDAQGGEMPPEDGDAGGGSELDSHINELQNLVSKGEKPSVTQMRKAVEAIANLRKSQKNAFQKKTEAIIPAQKAVVDNILKKWEAENKKPSENLEELIQRHGLTIED